MKSKVTINMDSFVLQEAKNNNVNISQTAEDAVRYKINYLKGDIRGVNLRMTELELEKEEKLLVKKQAKVAHLKETLQKIKDLKAAEQEKELQKEKERIETSKKCINCSNFIEFKSHEFPAGNVCQSCFLSATSEQVRKWNEVWE